MKAYELPGDQLESSELADLAKQAGYESLRKLLNDLDMWSLDVQLVKRHCEYCIGFAAGLAAVEAKPMLTRKNPYAKNDPHYDGWEAGVAEAGIHAKSEPNNSMPNNTLSKTLVDDATTFAVNLSGANTVRETRLVQEAMLAGISYAVGLLESGKLTVQQLDDALKEAVKSIGGESIGEIIAQPLKRYFN